MQSNKELANNKQLKEVETDGLKQSTFLPILQKAETKIKQLIVYYFWHLKSKSQLRIKIMGIIKATSQLLPKDLKDKDAYVNGLARKADQMINSYYDKALITFLAVSSILVRNMAHLGLKPPNVETPEKLVTVVNTKTRELKLNQWAEAKGAVRVENYYKQIQMFVNNVTGEVITTSETGKKPISLWQKAELEIRHDKQMEMLEDIRSKGVKYAWTSSHLDCSKRCEKWQGKLFNIDSNAHSELSGFRMRERVDGHTVYCLNDVISQKDKYGYENNIISGFNCRHYLIPHTPSRKESPTQYTETDIKKQRAIETKIREMEREIRLLKTKEQLYNSVDKTQARLIHRKVVIKVNEYKRYCESHGYAWKEYRIKVI